YDEFDFANEPYVCFRRRDPKAVRKTRAGQAVNNADKLVQLHYNFSQALAIAEAVLEREGFKQLAAIESETLWNARKPMADLFRSVPGLITKADEERLTERPKKIRPNKSTLPKVKVLPPSHPGGANGALAPAILPSERAFIIQKEILQSVQEDTDWLRSHACLDVTDDSYQAPLVPRADKMWVDIPSKDSSRLRGMRMRFGRGGRRFIDRRSSQPHVVPLWSERRNDDDVMDACENDIDDQELERRVRAQWRFDADTSFAGLAEDEHRMFVDEHDTKYLVSRLQRDNKDEFCLVTDASIVTPGGNPDGSDKKHFPFVTNALHTAFIHGKHLGEYFQSIGVSSAPGPRPVSTPQPVAPRFQPPAPVRQVSRPVFAANANPSATIPKMQESISPGKPTALNIPVSMPSRPSPVSNPRAVTSSPPASETSRQAVIANGQAVNGHTVNGHAVNGQAVNGHAANGQAVTGLVVNGQPVNGQTVVMNGHAANGHGHSLHNGARSAHPTYVPLGAGAGMSLKLPYRPSAAGEKA
ncbi:unnamed protein product, partial [Mycena citricolor]